MDIKSINLSRAPRARILKDAPAPIFSGGISHASVTKSEEKKSSVDAQALEQNPPPETPQAIESRIKRLRGKRPTFNVD